MDTYKSHGVYRKVPIQEAYDKTGKKPIKVRWVIVNKGDSDNPEYTARLVAKEIKMDTRLDLFAATPPLKAKKFLFSLAVSKRSLTGQPYKLCFIDIKRAYFHARCIKDVYVDLPSQDHQEGMCGKLEKAMYGTRDAAQNWEKECESVFNNIGFKQGKSSPCLFHHPEKDLRVVVHGDDFTILGVDPALKWNTKELQKVYGFKVKATLGPEPYDDKSVRILNKVVTWNEHGIMYEPDQRHVEIVIKALGLEKGKSVVTPGEKAKADPDLDKPIESATSTLYRYTAH